MPLRRLFALVVAALALVAGCGGDDDAASPGGGPGERSHRDEANAVCGEVLGELASRPEPETPDEAVAAYELSARTFRTLADRLRALDPPADEEQALDDLHGRLDGVAHGLDDLADVVRRGDQAAFEQDRAALEATTAELNADYSAAGLATCAE